MTAASSSPTPSGIAAVDDRWGGLRPGSAALLVGRAGAGRTALAMAAVRSAVDAGQTCLLLSPRETEALAEAARAAGVDIAALHKTGRLRVLRIPSATDLAAKGNAGLDSAYRDLGALAVRANAQRVVIEDFTPLVQYTTFQAFGEAFGGLRATMAKAGAAFLLGLGEPANEPSQRLLDVVQARVDATIRVASGENGPVVTVEATEAPAAQAPAAQAPAAQAPAAQAPAAQPVAPPEAAPVSREELAPAVYTEPAPPEAPTPAPRAEPAPTPTPAPLADPDPIPEPVSEDDFFASAPTQPFDTSSFASSDGASLPLDEPLAPSEPMPSPGVGAPSFGIGETTAPRKAVQESFAPPLTPTILSAGVEMAPPPDPDLLAPTSDPFGRDPGGTFFDNGYLVDSKGATTIPVTTVHQEAYPQVFTPPAQASAPAQAAPAAMPSFASISPPGGIADNGSTATRQALDAAFAARDNGTPFLVVAARMEPSQPESISFETVIDGLRTAIPSGATLYADATRLRSLLVLPGAGASGAQQIFATLQKHLQKHLGPQAESTLQAVAAITVPDGQPFGSSDELWQYAVEN